MAKRMMRNEEGVYLPCHIAACDGVFEKPLLLWRTALLQAACAIVQVLQQQPAV
jgi:hypothetical protein